MLKPATVRWLRQALVQGRLSRAALARELCARDQWNNARGKPCAASARKALPQLAAQLGLALPAAGKAAARVAASGRGGARPSTTQGFALRHTPSNIRGIAVACGWGAELDVRFRGMAQAHRVDDEFKRGAGMRSPRSQRGESRS